MFSILKKRLGIPGLLAIIALVFAMGGAAWAAKKYVVTSTAQIKPSVLKDLEGANGPRGATGAQGPAGANGTNGKDGSNGSNGKNGDNGTSGNNGKSVTTGNATPAECVEGGSTVEVEGVPSTKKKICNGEEGSPWAAGGLLPSNSTETGTWAGNTAGVEAEAYISISLALPTEPALTPVYEGTTAEGCPGIVNQIPTAAPGKLCVYNGSGEIGEIEPGTVNFLTPLEQNLGAGPSGTILTFKCKTSSCLDWGSWAATAE
jgi:hypothetical protein